MKKNRLILTGLGCVCFSLVAASMVWAEDAATTANQVTSELQKSGVVTKAEAKAIQGPLKNMAAKGATKKDLKIVVTDLSQKGVKGEDLKKSMDSMNDLVNQGENPKEAGNVVSSAAAQAHLQGLKGKDLAARVHEAVRQRKEQRNAEKKKAGKAETTEKAKKAENAESAEKSQGKEAAQQNQGQGKGKGK